MFSLTGNKEQQFCITYDFFSYVSVKGNRKIDKYSKQIQNGRLVLAR